MVDKDYNHPSVIMYSTGNEVAETAQKKGIALTGDMTNYLHSLIPPVLLPAESIFSSTS